MSRAPVAFILFNRPDETARVFAAIREAKPSKLLLIADGPRDAEEHVLCERARAAVVNHVDWPCEVRLNFSESNLGCKRRVSSGIDWVFDQVEEAIILEDDCLPDPTFFPFCDALLERYRRDKRVMHIGGSNFQFGRRVTEDSYYFSAINQIWGWASWRRAWQGHYDVTMRRWPDVRDTNFLAELLGEDVARRVAGGFENIYAGKTDSWDNQWTLAVWMAGGLTALPATNLVSNIGFGARATHTKKANSAVANQPTEPLTFPLRHPPTIRRDRAADDQSYRNMIVAKAM
jgi:hypothetical protein